MTRQIISTLALLCLPFLGHAQNHDVTRIAILSDVHIMAPELLKKEGKAFTDYLVSDRKLLVESPEILDSAYSHVARFRPQVILLPGDLTKDGEWLSHQLLINRYLKRMEADGARVFVIPGNHDVNNPHARVFDGDTAMRTRTVSAQEFADIYKDYGYGEAIARDDSSLSYVVQLDPHTRLLALDACRYEDNSYEKNTCVTGGRLKEATMQFIADQTADARRHNCRLITMMHHGIVPHWSMQPRVMPDYLVANWKKRAKQFVKMGITSVFTGHFHSQDVSKRKIGGRTLTDIETGSTVSYPNAFRLVELTPDSMRITSHYIRCLGSIPGGHNAFEEKSKDFAKSAITTATHHIMAEKVPQDVCHESAEVLSEAYLRHLIGNEINDPAFLERIKKASKCLRKYSWKYAMILNFVSKSFVTDDTPDQDVTIAR